MTNSDDASRKGDAAAGARAARRNQKLANFHATWDATWKERLLVLGGLFGALVVSLIFGLLYSPGPTKELLSLVPVSMVAVGKFLPLWGVNGESNFSPWELGLVIWILDTCTVLVIVYAIEGFYKLAFLKRALVKVQSNASLVLTAYPRIRKSAVIGVVCFVLFPVAGTGAMVGAFLGILLGLHRGIIIAAVSVGGFVGGMVMAALAVNARGFVMWLDEVQKSPAVKWTTISVMVVLGALALRWLSRAYKNAIELAKQQEARDEARELAEVEAETAVGMIESSGS